MNTPKSPKLSLKKVGTAQRKSITISEGELIKVAPLQPNQLPLVIEPMVDGLDLISWAQNNRLFMETQLPKSGGILFRNFKINGIEVFEQFVKATSDGKFLPYQEGSSPRTLVKDHIYTSTDYPADQNIFLHSELSYANTWPLKVYFHCVKPAEQGGETPIADIRKVCDRIPLQIRDRFLQKEVMYVRNFGAGLGLPWQKAFQTSDKTVVEAYCHENDIEMEWKEGDKLRTRQIRPAVVNHPKTGETVWFNHAAFFHVSTLEAKIRQAMLAFSEIELPYNTYYGDGSPIEPEVLEEIRSAYRQETVMFPWQAGDILMLDNMLTAHGRTPFVGSRQVVVGMAEPFSSSHI
ncbi:TauD/TfdA family dioxygenase [Coleofasciculus sp. H7-2]|uniref:TauD/TfdA family dioxygenase n=1 Tax=Coleofasciculus sp. H7-2 TaxID=3351545 RepID=UPI00366BF544